MTPSSSLPSAPPTPLPAPLHALGLTYDELSHPEGRFPRLGRGADNTVYQLSPDLVLRVTTGPLRRETEALEEMQLTEELGRSGIGPRVLWHGHLGARYGSVQERMAHGDLLHAMAERPEAFTPEVCRSVAEQLLHLICRVAAQGMIATDLKPMNVGVTQPGAYVDSPHARLLDFDPYHFRQAPPGATPAALTYAMTLLLLLHLRLDARDGGAAAAPARRLQAALRELATPVALSRASRRAVRTFEPLVRNAMHYFGSTASLYAPDVLPFTDSPRERVGPLRFSEGLPAPCRS